MDGGNPQQPVQPSIPEPSSGSSKIVVWFLGGLVIIILLVGAIYIFLSKQIPSPTVTNQTVTPVPPKPADTVDALDRDLASLEVDTATKDADSDFESIDQDLQNL